MRFILLLLISLSPLLISAQERYVKPDSAFINKTNTAQTAAYLSLDEKSVIFYLNAVRTDPKLFVKNYLKPYLDSTKENDAYTKTLIQTLEKTESMPLLQSQKDLYQVAKTHAVKCGKEGIVGHGNFNERFKQIKITYKGFLAENCDYGKHSPLEIVIRLLIDEGIKDLGHRKNILNPVYKNIGVSIEPHTRFKQNCVMDFGG